MDKLKAVECVGYTHIETDGGRGIAYDMLVEDARRVVACVNKFAGMETKEIEELPADVPMLLKRLSERSLQVDQLQEVCAEAYQFAGAYDAPVEVLDNLHAAANGLPIPHESFLPVDDSELVKRIDRAERALFSAGWTYKSGAAEWKPPLGQPAAPLLDKIDQISAQCDQLLKALGELVDQNDNGIMGVSDACWSRAKAAIAAVKGE